MLVVVATNIIGYTGSKYDCSNIDLHTGFLLIGGSQPTCKYHFILRAVARKIPHLYVGQELMLILNKCYDI